jgi:hypothetical protein
VCVCVCVVSCCPLSVPEKDGHVQKKMVTGVGDTDNDEMPNSTVCHRWVTTA